MLIPTQKAYIRKEESSPTVMCAAPASRPPLYNTANTMRFPDRPVCETQQERSTFRFMFVTGIQGKGIERKNLMLQRMEEAKIPNDDPKMSEKKKTGHTHGGSTHQAEEAGPGKGLLIGQVQHIVHFTVILLHFLHLLPKGSHRPDVPNTFLGQLRTRERRLGMKGNHKVP